MSKPYDIVVLGLSITSSWGNGHATTWRSLLKGLGLRGQRVLFLERDQPWYAAHRDLQRFPYCEIRLYTDVETLQKQYADAVRQAGAVIVGSYVPDGVRVSRWALDEARGVTAFYDIDTPVTLAGLREGRCGYLTASLIPEFDLYLSFTGGPLLKQLETRFAARCAVPLYCSVDIDQYQPETSAPQIDLGYMGTYSEDRQEKLEALLIEPALMAPERRFEVAGAQYPADIAWPSNVRRIEHLAPAAHREFYTSQRYTLNLTRADMVQAGYSPSVRLFEAAACAVPIVSDAWPGLEEFFVVNEEIFVARDAADVMECLNNVPETLRRRVAAAARQRVLMAHSGVRRAIELDAYLAAARHRSDTTATAV